MGIQFSVTRRRIPVNDVMTFFFKWDRMNEWKKVFLLLTSVFNRAIAIQLNVLLWRMWMRMRGVVYWRVEGANSVRSLWPTKNEFRLVGWNTKRCLQVQKRPLLFLTPALFSSFLSFFFFFFFILFSPHYCSLFPNSLLFLHALCTFSPFSYLPPNLFSLTLFCK